MKKIVESIINVLYWAFTIIFISISILLFFVDKRINYLSSQVEIIANIFWLLPIIIGTFILVKYHRKIKIIPLLTFKSLIIAQIVLLISQIFIAYNIYFYTGWDASMIRNTAFLMIEHSDKIADQFRNYYSYHVNQTSMVILLGLIMRFFFTLRIENFYFGTVLVSVLIVNLSGFLMTLSIYKITMNKRISFIAWLLFLLLGSLSPWITIPYSDTYSMIFPIFSLFIYLHLPKNFFKYIGWFMIAFLSIVGMLIKPQTIIILIAILIVEIFKFLINLNFRSLLHILAILSIIILASFSSNYVYQESLKLVDFDLIPGREFTYAHYLMTGLNPERYGVYSESDAALSYATGSIEERETINFIIINDRLKTMGLLGYLEFSMHKVLTNFNDGSFSWGGEGGFYVEIFKPKTVFSNSLRNFYYHSGDFVQYFFQLTQILWLWVIFLIPFNIIKKNKLDYNSMIIILTVIGITLFSHIFEARGRYLFSYLPFFILAAALALNELYKRANPID